jgi:hypothetical protein
MGSHSSDKRSTKSPGRPAKVPVGGVGGGHTNPPAPGRRELEGWLANWLGKTKRMAVSYRRDFLKSREKNIQSPGVRARLEGLLDTYSDWTEKLGEEFRNIPTELHAVIAEIEVTGRGFIWAASKQAAACVDRIHAAIERNRIRIAAPMGADDEKEFWRDTKDLFVGLTNLRKLAEALRKAIRGRREIEDTDAMEALNQTCDKLCNSIVQFATNVETTPGSSIERIRDVQDAADIYRRQLTGIDTVFRQAPTIQGINIHDEAHKTYTVRLEDVKAAISLQIILIDVVLFTHNLYHMLPDEASSGAIEIEQIVNDIQRESVALAAKIETYSGDPNARCDTYPETELPDYTRLGDTEKEHEQFRVIVDALVMLYDSRGSDATMDRKRLQELVKMLAGHRKVAGLAATSLWNKLDRLVGRKLVRKISAVKTRENPNAADEYRLAFPAQSKFSYHAGAVRAEFERIAAPNPAADPLD